MTAANALQACCICGRQVAGPDRPDLQNHIGEHILHRLRKASRTWDLQYFIIQLSSVNINPHFLQVSMQYPCGFCAQSSLNGAC